MERSPNEEGEPRALSFSETVERLEAYSKRRLAERTYADTERRALGQASHPRIAERRERKGNAVKLAETFRKPSDPENVTLHPVNRWDAVKQHDSAAKASKRSLAATKQHTGHGKPMLTRVSGGYTAAALGKENLARDVSRFDPSYQLARLEHKAREIAREMIRIAQAGGLDATGKLLVKARKLSQVRTAMDLVRLKA